MPFYRRDDWLQNALGQALAGGKVYYCSQPANTGTIPPSPLVSVYSDAVGTPATNPQTTDGFGHAVAYLAPGTYTVVYTHPQMGTIVLLDQQVSAIGSTPRIQADTSNAGTITGNIDGTNKTFGISFAPSPTNSLLLFLNGIQQIPNVSYTLNVSTVTFTNPPPSGASLVAFYFY